MKNLYTSSQTNERNPENYTYIQKIYIGYNIQSLEYIDMYKVSELCFVWLYQFIIMSYDLAIFVKGALLASGQSNESYSSKIAVEYRIDDPYFASELIWVLWRYTTTHFP